MANSVAPGLFFTSSTPAVPVRAIHLDLKGLPPTPDRLLALLDVIAAMRYNALLVEWEDSFPWTVDLRFRSETAYAPEVVDRFHARAQALGLQVIPLVQCLAHMETPLAVDDYAHLREEPERFGVLNPLAAGAGALVQRMVDDVLARMPSPPKYFHLGGDEAFTFGTHPDTRAYIAKHGKAALYLHHVSPLLDALIARGIRPILWHDMMHDWDAAALRALASKADLMVWAYGGHPDDAEGIHSTRVIERMHAAGVALWGAAAFKGADGHGDQDLPDLPARQKNAMGWTDVCQRFKMTGVVATGWSRYTTLRVQCEPIDAALDAMLHVAAIFHDGKPATDAAVEQALEQMGEAQRWRAGRDALRHLRTAREQCWLNIRLLRGYLAEREIDPRRREKDLDRHYLNGIERGWAALTAAANDVRAALAGLTDDIWIERYLAERLLPIQREREQIAAS